MIARAQLLALGFSSDAIRHRIATGRLHPVRRGIYAVGRPELTQKGHWMAAVLSGGPEAALSHASAAALWEIRRQRGGEIEVSVPIRFARSGTGIVFHRRASLAASELTRGDGIPVTTPVCTLIDLAPRLSRDGVEAAINEADKRNLVDPEALRRALEGVPRRPGLAILREILDRHTFTLTDSALERRFLPIVRRAGLPRPLTQQAVNGFRVDFYWPDLGLVVETDGLRYHRTPAEQARDRLRDQRHAAAGLVPLRFTRAQVRYEPVQVQATLERVARRLLGDRRST